MFIPETVFQNAALLSYAILITLWTLPWKAWALWLAARRGEKWWFIALFLINTVAILEIIYIFAVAKRSDVKEESVADTNARTS